MKLGIDFNVGDTLWYCYVRFSGSSARVTVRCFPCRVKVVLNEDPLFSYLANEKDGKMMRRIDHNIDYSYCLFKTEEEANQYWRSCFLNKMDQVRSKYEKDIKYLENYMKRKK